MVVDAAFCLVPMPEAGKVAIAFVRCKCVYALFRFVIASGIRTEAVFAGHIRFSGKISKFNKVSDARTATRFTGVRMRPANFE